MSMQKATLIPGGSESLIYATINGSVGALVPFTSREDYDFFQHLEMHMRNENPPLCGRDHLSYRSYYYPVKVNSNFFNPFLTNQFITIVFFQFSLDRTLWMVIYVNSLHRSIQQNKRTLQVTWVGHQMKWRKSLKTFVQDMHFKWDLFFGQFIFFCNSCDIYPFWFRFKEIE